MLALHVFTGVVGENEPRRCVSEGLKWIACGYFVSDGYSSVTNVKTD